MEDYVQEALEIVKAQASVRNMSEEELNSMVIRLSKQLRELVSAPAEDNSTEGSQEPAVDPKKAIRERSVICLECGKSFKVLNKRHLAKHGLTSEEYKNKWGYAKNASLIAKYLSRQRKKKIQEIELWKRRKNVNIQILTDAILQDFESKQ